MVSALGLFQDIQSMALSLEAEHDTLMTKVTGECKDSLNGVREVFSF